MSIPSHEELLAACVEFDNQADEPDRAALLNLLTSWKEDGGDDIRGTILACGLAQVGIGPREELEGWKDQLREFGALLRTGGWVLGFISQLYRLSDRKPFTPESALAPLALEIEDFHNQLGTIRQVVAEYPEVAAAELNKVLKCQPELKARLAETMTNKA